MMKLSALLCLLALPLPAGAAAPAGATSSDPAPDAVQVFSFRQAVANIEVEATSLNRTPPSCLLKPHASGENVWYGEVLGRRKVERKESVSPLAGFEAVFEHGAPISARYDANSNGDLTDDPEVKLFAYPPIEGARSFLARLQWQIPAGGPGGSAQCDIRVVLQPQEGDRAPLFRAQIINAMTGDVAFDGRWHKAFLFDANVDGLYTKEGSSADGLYLDLDDDGRVSVDTVVEFVPFSRPIHVGPGVYEIVSLDPLGAGFEVRRTGTAEWVDPPKAGKKAPDFTYTDTSGRRVALEDYRGRYVLVYFWASWCNFCRGQADAIKAIHDRFKPSGFEILGVSADSDRDRMEAFRADHGHTWPTSFSGIRGRGDPVIALYRPMGIGAAYLVAPDGIVEGVYGDMDQLASRLEALLGPKMAAAAR